MIKKKQTTKMQIATAKHTSSKKPFPKNYKASQYIQDYCNGDLKSAGNEWCQNMKGNVNLMTPKVTGIKGGEGVRWVKAKN